MFDDDVWDFANVIGLPMQMPLHVRRLDFTMIVNLPWRMVAKELVFALLVPWHEAVAPLPRAYRTPLHLRTCHARLAELTSWLNWLTGRGVTSLDVVDDEHCQAYLAHRKRVQDEGGRVIGDRGPTTQRAAAQTVVDLVNYRELFTVDRVSSVLRPWAGAAPSAIAGMPSGRTENKTPPVSQTTLQPLLAAAFYLINTLGSHTVALLNQSRQASRLHNRLPAISRVPAEQFTALMHRYTHDRVPLPRLPEHDLRQRLTQGWAPEDPLLPVSLRQLAHEAGFLNFPAEWREPLRDMIEDTLARVGTAKPWGRDAREVASATGQKSLPWTLPLHNTEVIAVGGIVRTACIIATSAVSGMRSSELMELTASSRLPPEEHGPGMVRYRLASKLIKGQPLGGLADEWVVVEPVYRAVELAEQFLDQPSPTTPLFGRFAFEVRYKWFRNWVNGPAGQRLGLDPIPNDKVTLRRLRRTLALELAYRPGGLLAAKAHLKHTLVATTEGYANRPGGAQAELLAEVNKHEQERNLDLVWAEFRNYQQGIMPVGPGARELIEFFTTVDGKLDKDAAGAPKVQRSNREVLNLLSKRAKALFLGSANFCWFTDPSRALCLKLAGTPNATKPLAGMCDSARCPQATHHPCHRAVWADTAATTKTFLGSLGATRKTEKARLQADYDRAQRVLAEIDAATGQHESEA
jgi:hypothetical protein